MTTDRLAIERDAALYAAQEAARPFVQRKWGAVRRGVLNRRTGAIEPVCFGCRTRSTDTDQHSCVHDRCHDAERACEDTSCTFTNQGGDPRCDSVASEGTPYDLVCHKETAPASTVTDRLDGHSCECDAPVDDGASDEAERFVACVKFLILFVAAVAAGMAVILWVRGGL